MPSGRFTKWGGKSRRCDRGNTPVGDVVRDHQHTRGFVVTHHGPTQSKDGATPPRGTAFNDSCRVTRTPETRSARFESTSGVFRPEIEESTRYVRDHVTAHLSR